MLVADGTTMHFHAGERVSDDVDATFPRTTKSTAATRTAADLSVPPR